MALLSRLVVLFPLALSIVAIVLSSLCLFSGHKENFMEDYAIVRLNTSMIGQNIIPWDKIDSDSSDEDDKDDKKKDDKKDDDDDGFFHGLADDAKDKFDDLKDDLGDKVDDVKDGAKDKINDLANGVAEDIADALNISDWYSIHIMAACEGEFEPNGTAPSPSLNVTGCTSSTPTYRLNLTDIIDKQLNLGPLDFTLADIKWPPEIQEKLDVINDLLLGLFIVYVIGMGFSGLAVIGSLVALILAVSRLVVLLNFTFSVLGAVALVAGSIIVTVGGTKGIDELNKVADDVGVHASRGSKFLTISWIAAAMMLLATVFWTVRFCFVWREKRREKRALPRKGSY